MPLDESHIGWKWSGPSTAPTPMLSHWLGASQKERRSKKNNSCRYCSWGLSAKCTPHSWVSSLLKGDPFRLPYFPVSLGSWGQNSGLSGSKIWFFLLHSWWECKLVQPLWRFLKKLKIELSYDPVIPLLAIYLEKIII